MHLSRFTCITLIVLFARVGMIQADDGFKPLFNGRTLEGWHGDSKLWSVENGAIIGKSDGTLKFNSFISTEKKYKNFVLKLKFKFDEGNSGIQFRSESLPKYVIRGYQADIVDNESMGILYEEKARGVLAETNAEEVAKHFRKGEWNDYVITADGGHITLAINGYTTVDYQEKSDKGATEGVVALQLHVGPAMKIEFKDIEIKELP